MKKKIKLKKKYFVLFEAQEGNIRSSFCSNVTLIYAPLDNPPAPRHTCNTPFMALLLNFYARHTAAATRVAFIYTFC